MSAEKETADDGKDVGQSGLGEQSGYGKHFDLMELTGCDGQSEFGEQCGFGDQLGFGEPSEFEEQSDIDKQSDFGKQSGFGDTLTPSEKRTCDSFDPICRELKCTELDTFTVSFTSYSQASSCEISSKFDDDVMTVSSEDVYSTNKRNCVFEVIQSVS